MHRLAYGEGEQSLRSVPLRDGRAVIVASADYAIIDLRYVAASDDHVLASGAATVDSVSTTISAAAGRGAADTRALTVASAAGISAGRRYLLTSGGRSELVKVEAVSGTTVVLQAALPFYFAAASTFRGVELVAAVAAEVTADDDFLGQNYLAVRWEPLGLLPYQEQVFLERVAPTPLLTPDALLNFDASLASYASDGMTPAQALSNGASDFEVDMLARDIDSAHIMAGPVGRWAVIHMAAWHMLKHSSDTSAVERATRYHARYQELIAQITIGAEKAKVVQTTADNTVKTGNVNGIFATSW